MKLKKKLMNLSKEYLNDPKSQYYRHLNKMLNLHKNSNVSKEDVLNYVKKWYNAN